MDFGIFNLMGAREPGKGAAQVLGEVAEQVRLADELGYGIAWFAEHHFSNYCLCPSPLLMVAHCAAQTRRIRLGTAVLVLPLYNPARLLGEIGMADALSGGRLELGIGTGYQPYEFERFGADLAQAITMTEEFCDLIDTAFTQDFVSHAGRYYRLPKTHVAGRPVQKKLPVWVAGHADHVFRLAVRRGYGVLTSGRTVSSAEIAEERRLVEAAYRAEGRSMDGTRFAMQRFCCITEDREEAMRFAENARYQSRLAGQLRRREEAMAGTMLLDRPAPGEPPLETIRSNLLIGSVEEVAEKLVMEIEALRPAHFAFACKVGSTPQAVALRTTELLMTEVRPLLERALGPLERIGAG